MKNKNGFAPKLIVLLIVILGIVGYLWIQSHYERYNNNKYGFEFSYPKEAKKDFGLDKIMSVDLATTHDMNNEKLSDFFSLGFQGPYPPGNLYVSLSIDEGNACDTNVSWGIRDATSQTVSIGGVKTIVYEGHGDKNTVSNEYMAATCITKAGYVYYFSAKPDSKHKDLAKKLYWQILMSFKFTKSASVTDIRTKKVGKQQIIINGNYGYEVTIPDGYNIENFAWAENDNYLAYSIVKDSSDNELLTITYGANGWASQENHQSIDGVNFEVTNSPLNCESVGYPIDQISPSSDNPDNESTLTVEIIVNCKGKDKDVQNLISSIKWSIELKDILSGKKPTLYIPNTRFGEVY